MNSPQNWLDWLKCFERLMLNLLSAPLEFGMAGNIHFKISQLRHEKLFQQHTSEP